MTTPFVVKPPKQSRLLTLALELTALFEEDDPLFIEEWKLRKKRRELELRIRKKLEQIRRCEVS